MVWDGDGVVDNVGNRVNKKRKETVEIGCLEQVDRVWLSRESLVIYLPSSLLWTCTLV